ncbi:MULTISPECIES: ROK family transcriptional regulator [Amycolatopsis]|uniref:Sugar kinase of the NBD/HSP70 family, may contain an N-terminal HTH domain n=2 Tax=Amycolatopsis TaxID=1813 RepID=A0A1I4BPH1_9PSEU|nr:ROK family transcriptional regulator [Amycolatopsis sacchari]SFK69876.1 Sugar kinase of the NBD/HSP70 family, may contain an N-terminal HTH domain [Amycolatopsis sacchari]
MTDAGRRNVRDLRRANRSRLLRELYFRGPLSRQDLISATGLSSASVSNVAADLIEAGVVVEAGAVESDGGRPRILLRVDTARFQVIGIDVGETRIRVERFDLGLAEQASADLPVDGARPDPRQVVEGIAVGLAELAADAHPVLGAGIGVPGIVRQDPTAVVHGQTVGWDGVPLEDLLRAHTDLPLFIDNGAATMGQAELWFGSGAGTGSAVFLLLGSGAGASLIADGASVTSAGEWGHTTVQIGGRRCRCGARGCLEAYVGAESVIARYLESEGAARIDPAEEERALGRILELAERDPSAAGQAARDVLGETALLLGVGIANLVNLLTPRRVIIGGWAGLALAPLLPRIREAAREHALRLPFSQVSIELGALGPDAVARGAATLPVAAFLASGGQRPALPAPGRVAG